MRRFVASLPPTPPGPEDEAWVAGVLDPGELGLWERLGARDRRHLVGVARRVDETLAGTAHAGDPRWVAAALLHDVGKAEAGLGVVGRVVATLADATPGVRARRWAGRDGLRGRVGRYLLHPATGARMIRAAGGREEVAAWAEVHQDPPLHGRAGLPPAVVAALVEADDD